MPRDRERDIRNARQRAINTRGILDQVKTRRGCALCQYNKYPEALDFNHYKGGKRADITTMVTYSWASIKAELVNCVVLCANCHRIYTRRATPWNPYAWSME